MGILVTEIVRDLFMSLFSFRLWPDFLIVGLQN